MKGVHHLDMIVHQYHRRVQEDQSDMVSGSESKTEVEEWDDIIAYDTEISRYTMVADQECCIACNHCRMNKCWHCEWHPEYGKTKQLSLPIFRDSTSDNVITYDNWRSDVDNYVQGGHSPKLIRDSILCVLEGHPATPPKWRWMTGMALSVASWKS